MGRRSRKVLYDSRLMRICITPSGQVQWWKRLDTDRSHAAYLAAQGIRYEGAGTIEQFVAWARTHHVPDARIAAWKASIAEYLAGEDAWHLEHELNRYSGYPVGLFVRLTVPREGVRARPVSAEVCYHDAARIVLRTTCKNWIVIFKHRRGLSSPIIVSWLDLPRSVQQAIPAKWSEGLQMPGSLPLVAPPGSV